MPIRWRAGWVLAVALITGVTVVQSVAATGLKQTGPPLVEATTQHSFCLSGTTAADLGRLFDSEPAGVVGADYQRAFALPDGRVFWTFQDGAVRLADNEITIVHNIVMLQDGPCFEVLYGGTRAAPESFLFGDRTEQYRRWFWPLDAELGSDGLLYVFTAEMLEEGDAYLSRSVPQRTRVAVFDPATDTVVSHTLPADSSAALYGWSITSDEQWTYLYAQCYRQFGFDEYATVAAFDRYCSPRVTVGRVPRGRLLDTPTYWNGSSWQSDPRAATPVIDIPGRRINADQIEWTGSSFVSVNKEGDWWGDTVYLSRSVNATGPFEVYDSVPVIPKCAECNTFFAGWIPAAAVTRPPSTLVFGLSHNRWDGVISALYRPTFHLVPAPPFLAAGRTFEMAVPGGADLGAAVLNVTAVSPRAPGYVTAFPCDRGRPTASNLNYVAADVVANLVVVRPDGDGNVCLFSLADTDLVVDLAGGFQPGAGSQPVDNPTRIADTRVGLGVPAERVRAGATMRVTVPEAVGAGAAMLNVTAVYPSAAGYVTAFACDRSRPTASNLNYVAADVVANLVVVRPDADGDVCLFSLAETDLVVDLAGTSVTGSVSDAGPTPRRLVDTRVGLGAEARRLAAGGTLEVTVPENAVATALNVTAVFPSAPGHLTVFPCDQARPSTSNLNYTRSDVVANLVIARADSDRKVCVFSLAETDLVVDLAGSFTLDSGYAPGDNPVRILDTRNGTGVGR